MTEPLPPGAALRRPPPYLLPLEVCRQALAEAARMGAPTMYGAVARYRREGTPTTEEGQQQLVDESIERLEQSLGSGLDRHQRSRVHHHLGNLYRTSVRRTPATDGELAISHYESALGGRDPSDGTAWGSTHLRLGQALLARARGKRACNVERALDSLRAASSAFDPTKASQAEKWYEVQMSLAAAYAERVVGDRRTNLDNALRIYRGLCADLTPGESGWREARYRMGNVHRSHPGADEVRHITAAIRCYRRVLRELREDATTAERARATHSLAVALAARRGDRDLDEAIRLYDRARVLRPVESHALQWAVSTRNLGDAHYLRALRVGRGRAAANVDLNQAVAAYSSALAIFRAHHSPLEIAILQHNLGLATNELERTSAGGGRAARKLIQVSLDFFLEVGLLGDAVHAAVALAGILAEHEDWQEAAAAYSVALESAQRAYETSFAVDGSGDELGLAAQNVHADAAYTAARTSDPQHAVLILEHSRARALGSVIEQDLLDLSRLESDHGDRYAAYRYATEWVRRVESRTRAIPWTFDAETSDTCGDDEAGHRTPSEDQAAGQLADIGRAEGRHARDEVQAVLDDIRELPGFEHFLRPNAHTDLWRAISSCAPLAYASCSQFGSLLLLVTQDPSGHARAEVVMQGALTARSLADVLDGARDGSLNRGTPPVNPTTSTRATLARFMPVLGTEFAAPLVAKLRGVGIHEVVLVACGLLATAPWGAALYEGVDGEVRLIDEMAISYAPSAKVLAARRAQVRVATPRDLRLVALADSEPLSAPLPMSRLEVRTAALGFPTSELLVGAAVTPPSALRAITGATHVHLAVHSEHAPLDILRSRFRTSTDPLSLADLMNGQLLTAVRLVAAPSCESAVTGLYLGSDEYLSLATGLLWAGAAAALGSLWAVADMPTSLLMSEFYRHYPLATDGREVSGPEALRIAQLWLAQLSVDDAKRRLHDLHTRMIEVHGPDPSVTRAVEDEFHQLDGDSPQSTPFVDPIHWAAFIYMGA